MRSRRILGGQRDDGDVLVALLIEKGLGDLYQGRDGILGAVTRVFFSERASGVGVLQRLIVALQRRE